MRRINYKSDFDFILHLYSCLVDAEGKEVKGSRKELGWPDYDWTAKFWTASKANAYTASCIGGECVNCREDNGMIRIVVNDHHMGPGQLKVEFRAELPDGLYPDGYQRNVVPEPLCIELVVGKGDLPTEIEAELLLPCIKGDKGDKLTYADLTEEDKADLIAPIKQDIDDIAEKKADREDLKSYPTNDEFNTALKGKQDTLATSVDLSISDGNRLSLTDRAKQHLFDDLWKEACGKWGTVDHTHVEEDGVERHYYLNELWLTYEEATAVYQAGAIDSTAVAKRYYAAKIRTNLPPVITGQAQGETSFVFECLHIADSSDIEVLNLASSYHSSLYNFKLSPANKKGTDSVFHNCPELRAIIGYICLQWSNLSPKGLFGICPKLEDVRVTAVSNDLDIKSLPKINVASIKFMIEKSSVPNDKTITITVHPDTYRKLTLPLDPDADGYADRDTAWDGLVELAATHKITFATA